MRLALLAGALVLAALVAARSRADRPEVAAVPVLTLSPARFVHEIRAEGNLKEVDSTPIGVPTVPAIRYTIAWIAEDGARVAEGDPLVRFDPAEMEKRLEDGRSDIAAADSKLAKARVESESKLGNLSLDARQATLELEASERFAGKDPDIFARNQIIESEIDQELAGERRDRAIATREIRESLARTEADLLNIERKVAALKADEAEAGLKGIEIHAPHAGIVLLERNWRGEEVRVGQTVWNGQPVARLPRLERMKAEVYVLEADAGGLALGKPATVRLEAHPELELRAKVSRLDSLAKPRVKDVPVQYFGVTLELETAEDPRLKPGARVTAAIRVEERADALSVPHQALFERDGRRMVWRRSAAGFEAVPVESGPASIARVVIQSGLAAGDVVALRDPGRSADEAARGASASPAAEAAPARPELPR